MSHGNPIVRRARESDLAAITDIYNEAIVTTTATFDTEPKTLDERRNWFIAHGDTHPVLVAEVDGQVVGFGCLTKWSERPAYNGTAETSFYVAEPYRGKGVGRALKRETIELARQLGFHTLIARVAEGSDASLHLNRQFGFQHIGTMREVGRKFGKLLDVEIYQLIFD